MGIGLRMYTTQQARAWHGACAAGRVRHGVAGSVACAAASLAGGDTLRMSTFDMAPPLATLSATAHRAW